MNTAEMKSLIVTDTAMHHRIIDMYSLDTRKEMIAAGFWNEIQKPQNWKRRSKMVVHTDFKDPNGDSPLNYLDPIEKWDGCILRTFEFECNKVGIVEDGQRWLFLTDKEDKKVVFVDFVGD